MPLSADIVGHILPERLIEVTPRRALAYAAAIGDDTAACFDDAADGFTVHPAYCVSLEWQVIVANRATGLGLAPDEVVRGVHAGQNTVFHRPIKPGTTARVTGEVVEVRATGAGALARTLLTTTDAATGDPLASTLTSSMYRGVAVTGQGSQASDLADVTESWSQPATTEDESVFLDRWFAHRYTECADIWNPIHTERRVALAAGLPDIIVHGTALWAIAARVLIARYAPGQPQRLAALAGRFSAMVLPGTPITVRHGPGTQPGTVHFSVLNVDGAQAVSRGVATIAR